MRLLERLSYDLNLKPSVVEIYLNNNKRKYSKFYIQKKNGGKRLIFHPSPILKALQYWLVQNIFNDMPVSKFATAYSKGSSIKNNAIVHKDCNYLLNMDIEDFFPSITKAKLMALLKKNSPDLHDEDIQLICKICLLEDRLTIGSVSSPVISNCIMYDFDMLLSEKLPKGITYTRYADDMTFSSGNYIDDDILVLVEDLLDTWNFKVNMSKTKFMSNAQRQIVTGLNINDGEVSIGLKRKREIKSRLYKKLTKDIGDAEQILGNLYFIKDIEPRYFDKIILKYSKYGNVVEKLKEEINEERIAKLKSKSISIKSGLG